MRAEKVACSVVVEKVRVAAAESKKTAAACKSSCTFPKSGTVVLKAGFLSACVFCPSLKSTPLLV